MKFSSRATLEVVILTTSSAGSVENFVKMTFLFNCRCWSLVSQLHVSKRPSTLEPMPKHLQLFNRICHDPACLHFIRCSAVMCVQAPDKYGYWCRAVYGNGPIVLSPHDDAMAWKHFPHCCFVRVIHWWLTLIKDQNTEFHIFLVDKLGKLFLHTKSCLWWFERPCHSRDVIVKFHAEDGDGVRRHKIQLPLFCTNSNFISWL